MASSLTNTRLIVFRAISKRWYSGRAVEEKAGMVKKSKKEAVVGVSSQGNTSSWVPDPVTGYYRPGNKRPEVDAAELRKAMLSHGSS